MPAPSRTAALLVLLGTGAVCFLVHQAARPSTHASHGEFSEASAQRTVQWLATDIGTRVAGSPGAARAAEGLTTKLRALPGVEVRVQHAEGFRLGVMALDYRVSNVLARIPGTTPEALLVSAHYDSTAAGPGAADNAASVAVALDVARVLAQHPLAHTVVFNFNDGEEQGLVGADAFLHHPWAKDVRAFINLDAAGAGGRPLLVRLTGGNAALTRAYARSVTRPWASALAQDLFQLGAVNSDTDYTVYAGAGWPGVDLALYEDGYVYHTALDRPDRLERGSLEEEGAVVLELLRGLDTVPTAALRSADGTVLYDVLGAISLRQTRAFKWASVFLLSLLIAWLTARRRAFSLNLLQTSLRVFVLPLLAAAASMAFAALLCALGLEQRWYGRPAWAALVYGAISVAAGAPWARISLRRASDDLASLQTAVCWVSLLWLWLLSATGLASAYLPLWATASSVVLLALQVRWPTLPPALGFFPLLPTLLAWVQAASLVLAFFAPGAGRTPLPIPFDLVLAAVLGLSTGALLLLLLTPLAALLPTRALWSSGLVVALLGTLLLATRPTYDAQHPKRIDVELQGAHGILVTAEDHPALRTALTARVGPCTEELALWRGHEACRVATPTGSSGAEERDAKVTSPGYQPGGATRTLTLTLQPHGATVMDLELPSSQVVQWMPERPVSSWPGAPYEVRVIEPPPDGWTTQLTLQGPPVNLKIVRHHPASAAELLAVQPWLQPWTVGFIEEAEETALPL